MYVPPNGHPNGAHVSHSYPSTKDWTTVQIAKEKSPNLRKRKGDA